MPGYIKSNQLVGLLLVNFALAATFEIFEPDEVQTVPIVGFNVIAAFFQNLLKLFRGDAFRVWNGAVDIAKPQSVSQVKSTSTWMEVTAESLEGWSRRLEAESCSYHQFPYWVKAYEKQGYRPKFFFFGDHDNPAAFVAVIEVGIYPFRFGLIDRGPVVFETGTDNTAVYLSALNQLAKQRGYVFLRFTQGQEDVYSLIQNAENVISTEPYPFCRDSRNSLLVEQIANDDEMISGFSHTARRDIRRAQRFEYEIRIASSETEFEMAWKLFSKLAAKKGFELSSKPKAFWHSIVKAGSSGSLARLYLCMYEGELIAAQLNVRDGNTCEVTLAALDIEALKDKPSPAALLYWIAMRDGYKEGCSFFNMGGPGDPKRNNHLFEFKRKFKPTLHVAPEPLCLVLAPLRYHLWINVLIRGWRAWRYRFGKSKRKPLPQPQTQTEKFNNK